MFVTFDGAVVTIEPSGSNIPIFKVDPVNNKIGIGQDPNNGLAQILQVQGTVGATAFIGDGNGLTNLSGFTGAGDGTEQFLVFRSSKTRIMVLSPSPDQMGFCLVAMRRFVTTIKEIFVLTKDVHGQDAGIVTTATIQFQLLTPLLLQITLAVSMLFR